VLQSAVYGDTDTYIQDKRARAKSNSAHDNHHKHHLHHKSSAPAPAVSSGGGKKSVSFREEESHLAAQIDALYQVSSSSLPRIIFVFDIPFEDTDFRGESQLPAQIYYNISQDLTLRISAGGSAGGRGSSVAVDQDNVVWDGRTFRLVDTGLSMGALCVCVCVCVCVHSVWGS